METLGGEGWVREKERGLEMPLLPLMFCLWKGFTWKCHGWKPGACFEGNLAFTSALFQSHLGFSSERVWLEKHLLPT